MMMRGKKEGGKEEKEETLNQNLFSREVKVQRNTWLLSPGD